MSWPGTLRWLAVALPLLSSGCGPAAEVRPPLLPMQGSLTINGEPAAGAMLVFHPADGKPFDSRGTRPTAVVDENGSFDLTTYQSKDGAPAGDYRVSILWFADPDSTSPWDRLGGRFANPDTTKIRASIEEGQTLLEPIRLTGVPLVTRRPAENSSDYDQVD